MLLQHLKTSGISLRTSSNINDLLPSELFITHHVSQECISHVLFNHPYIGQHEISSNMNDYHIWIQELNAKCHSYYYSVIRKMCQLRIRRLSVHNDIHYEVDRCYGVSENLLSLISKQRLVLDQSLKQISTLQQWYINLSSEIAIKEADIISDDNVDYVQSSSSDIESLFWRIREKLACFQQCTNTLITVYTKITTVCDKQRKAEQINAKKNDQKQDPILREIFNSEELAYFEEVIPDFIADNNFEDDSKITNNSSSQIFDDPIIQSLINSKQFLMSEYSSALKKIQKISVKLIEFQNAFSDISLHKMSEQNFELMYHELYDAFWYRQTFSRLLNIDQGLQTLLQELKVLPCYSNLNVNFEFESKSTCVSIDTTFSEQLPFETCYQNIISEFQLCIQDMVHVIQSSYFSVVDSSSESNDNQPISSVENSVESEIVDDELLFASSNMNEKEDMFEFERCVKEEYMKYQHTSFVGSVKAFHGKEIAQKLQLLIKCLQNKSNFEHLPVIHQKLNNICCMLSKIIEIARYVFNHNLQTHKSFCKLGYIVSSLFNGLFIKGFCKKNDEQEEDQRMVCIHVCF